MNYHCLAIRTPKKYKKKKIKNVVIPNDEDAQQLDYSYIAVGNAKFPMVW